MPHADGDKARQSAGANSSEASARKRISRREFGREAAIATAATITAPALLAPPAAAAGLAPAQKKTPEAPPSEKRPEALEGLTPQQAADVEAKLANILRQYGSRFDAGQKEHLRRILVENERLMAPVRAFPLQNGDPPASVLRIRFDHPRAASEKSED